MDGATQKTVYLIRHGQSTFNLAYKVENKDPWLFDARLTSLGETQADGLRNLVAEKLHDIELIVSSPLTRAMDTTNRAFREVLLKRKELKVRVIKHHSEYVCTSDDNGRHLSEVSKEFPHFDFTEVTEERWWYVPDQLKKDLSIDYQEYFKTKGYREPYEDLKQRFIDFKEWLLSQKESKIAVVGHSDFFYHLFKEKLPVFANCQVLEWNIDTDESKFLN
ncbi:phosphoglycerate/bisphosphoglycerate mutase family protein [Tieghemostelium lacteum]|uniref:Phosphoglycerate/bisphosphoglycerate mutase family protein n=1 Tax=Tieghemostelium lacteum TaxID=361077 RepID=A0A151ZC82_TIELA|nr:phosphoglycerate/bisphosphoglycerate mutase family protein [Tieghemostelium lacteum]|eukprot:KYQ91557.1 phosphoglycerate/bisphosphoglycerate mutase family protein [Tieghemostelium lacteum]